MKEKTRSDNQFIFLRHGESESNVENMISSVPGQYGDRLTQKGREQVRKVKDELKGVDLIFVSPFNRTKETAEIVADGREVIEDERLKEIFAGDKNGKSYDKYSTSEFEEKPEDVRRRVMDFIFEIDKKYRGKKILIVSHGLVGSILMSVEDRDENVQNAVVYNFDFAPFPHDDNYQLDFHRPYIDQITFEENGKKYEFVKEVFDCWFESGSMPFASRHYPFENKEVFDPSKHKGFPADFIAEGQDQTRG